MPPLDQSQLAAQEIQKLIREDWFQPQILRQYLAALKAWQPGQVAAAIDGRPVFLNRITYDLKQFFNSLPPITQQKLAPLGLTSSSFENLPLSPQTLTALDQTLIEISGLPSEAPFDGAKEGSIPANLLELVAEAEAAQKASQITKQPFNLKSQIEKAQQINIYAQQLKVNTTGRLFHLLKESSYVKDLQTIYGRDNVNQLLRNQIASAAQTTITALVINQKALTDPQQATAYFTGQLLKTIKDSEVLRAALAKTDRQTKKDVTQTIKNETEKILSEVQPTVKEFYDQQKTAPLTKKSAKQAAVEIVASASQKAQISLNPLKSARLIQELSKNANQPDKQISIIQRSFPQIPPSQIQAFHSAVQPVVSRLAGLPAKPDSLAHLVLVNRALFPRALIAKLEAGLQAGPAEQAVVLEIANRLNIPFDAALLYRSGLNQKTWPILERYLSRQPILLNRLIPIRPHLQTIQQSVQPESIVLDSSLARQYARPANFASRNLHFQEFFRPVNLLSRFSNLTIQQFNNSSFFSALRVRSAPVNFIFNSFESVSGGFRSIPRIITSPFRAAGNFINTRIFSPVKTWIGNQARAGLAKAGAWVAKTGVGKAAKALAIKLGGSLLAKGTAALLANAVPVIGQIASAISLLSMAGDIAKLAWNNRETIAKIGLGLLSGGLILFSKLLGLLGTAAWGLGGGVIGGIIGSFIGGPIGAAIGAISGGAIGAWIGSGGLTSALASAGTWLGTAAAGVGNFLAGLSVPISGSVITTISVWSVLGGLGITAGVAIVNNIQQNSALVVPVSGAAAGSAVSCFEFVTGGQSYPKPYDGSTPLPELSDPWTAEDSAKITEAINNMLTNYGNYMSKICSAAGTIKLWRDSHSATGWGGWMMSDADIRIYNNGVADNLYTLSHESGHVYDNFIGTHDFESKKFVYWSPAASSCEKNIYLVDPANRYDCIHENFAEGISWYISGHGTLMSAWYDWLTANIFN